MTRYEMIFDLAKEIELWIANIRYKNNNINQEADLHLLWNISRIRIGAVSNDLAVSIFHNALDKVKHIEPVPEDIKNKLLALEIIK